jgi:two-component system, NtrC family, sensor kinase
LEKENGLDEILDKLFSSDDEKILEIARFAELGMSASAVIHEVRQPMTALSVALQIIHENVKEKDKKLESDINEAILLVSKAELLLERARDFMRPSDGVGDVDLQVVIDKVLSVLYWQISNKSNVEIIVSAKENIPFLKGDRIQLEQMLANLVSNALDAITESNGGKIQIVLKQLEQGIDLVVADTGAGIDEEIKERIFHPFFSTKAKSKGTGLGLYIVSKIASRHNATCSFMTEQELAKMNLQEYKTGFRVLFAN